MMNRVQTVCHHEIQAYYITTTGNLWPYPSNEIDQKPDQLSNTDFEGVL